tara:strand:- start:1012 stop:2319 length:1308 start_codon:yes stop_codon:yes gene_type:complete
VTYSKDILNRLELLHPKKIDLSLNRLKILLRNLGNPHLKISPVIHIAGTNGKGSVTAFLRSIFESFGLKVNVYTSPHLRKFNERIRLKSKLISTKFLHELLEECEEINKGKQITFFEITTAAAFLAFSRKKADILILETGLGGRFDATNVIKNSICSVLTPISIDHTNLLGNSLSKITREKLGIIKPNSMAVISNQNDLVKKLIRNYAKKNKVEIFQEGKDWRVIKKDFSNKVFHFECQGKSFKLPFPKLFGEHQIDNAATAVATYLYQNFFPINMKAIRDGIVKTNWPARMQKLDSGRLSKFTGRNFEIWLDGGHNIHACEAVSQVFQEWKDEKIFLVIGMVEGKDPINFIKKLSDQIETVSILPINNHQYIHPNKIKNILNKKPNGKLKIQCCTGIFEALEEIKNNYISGKIMICGSLYLAGEVLAKDGYLIK